MSAVGGVELDFAQLALPVTLFVTQAAGIGKTYSDVGSWQRKARKICSGLQVVKNQSLVEFHQVLRRHFFMESGEVNHAQIAVAELQRRDLAPLGRYRKARRLLVVLRVATALLARPLFFALLPTLVVAHVCLKVLLDLGHLTTEDPWLEGLPYLLLISLGGSLIWALLALFRYEAGRQAESFLRTTLDVAEDSEEEYL